MCSARGTYQSYLEFNGEVSVEGKKQVLELTRGKGGRSVTLVLCVTAVTSLFRPSLLNIRRSSDVTCTRCGRSCCSTKRLLVV
jgi:hypothetical protein